MGVFKLYGEQLMKIQIEPIAQLLETAYGISGTLTRLAGENENYLIHTNQNNRFVLKLADEQTTTGMIEIEHMAVECLVDAGLDINLPRVIPTKEGKIEARFVSGTGVLLRGRVLEFVKGQAWCDSLPAEKKRLTDLGQTIAQINNAISTIDHSSADRTHHWNLAEADQHCSSIDLVQNPERREILEQVFLWYAAIARPRFQYLPKGLIHADINDDNVLVTGNRIAGILDFGDCLYNPIICDLAIALAYHTLDENDPLEAGAVIVEAYHNIRPLTYEEIEILFPLICTRLAVSVIISAQRRKIDPTRKSWFVSEERAWKKLIEFSKITPVKAAQILASRTNLIIYPDQGESPEDLALIRKTCIATSMSVSYPTPLKMVTGKGQYLYDYNGQPFLDMYNNVCHVGHCHPHVVTAGQTQMSRLNTNTRYLYDSLTQYAQKLCATLPSELDTCFFVNSGSEANELALRIAKTVTGHSDMLVVENAYHGHTQAMIDISPYKFMGKGGRGRPEPWVHVVPVADGYRGAFKGQGSETGKAYGDQVGQILDQLERPVAGFITESLLSCGGQVIPPDHYLKTAFAYVRQAGGLCICDEVQVGFGRTGSHFWAFELQGVVPDIVVMGKPIGNGHPMSAVVTRKEIADKFANGMEFFATFGGNPVSCAIGTAVLEVIEQENLQDHARKIGQYLLEGMAPLKKKHKLIGDIRGIGLFIGIELVKDRDTLEPAGREANEIVNKLKNQKILLGTDGPFENVIKIKPPMVMTKRDAQMFIRILDQLLSTF